MLPASACTSGALRKASAMAIARPVGATGLGAGFSASGLVTGLSGWLTGGLGSETGA
ncbi:hypothetical protein D3C86_1910500 [compost metagenome]